MSAGLELDAEANIRVRELGHPICWAHPVLSGDLLFHGNRYRVAKRHQFCDPSGSILVNVEASTTIQQYEITLNSMVPKQADAAYRSDRRCRKRHRYAAGAGQTARRPRYERSGSRVKSSSACYRSGIPGRGRWKIIWDHNFRVDPGLPE